jgi:hypothetical protein
MNKISSSRLIGLISLIGAISGSTNIALAHHGHDYLSDAAIVTTKTFALLTEAGETGIVTVQLQVLTPKAAKDVSYRATIVSSVDGPVILSLYNLGLQGRAHDTEISGASADVEISTVRDAGNPQLKWKAAAKGEKLAASKPGSGANPVDEFAVRLIRFKDTCTLEIVSKRKIHSPMQRTSHDTTPPPPDPGGQDGAT